MSESNQTISAEFPYDPKYVEVHGSKMHYVEQGQGDPIVFIHGIPTSCYLWRNILPPIAKHARCIALDLIGMGKSDKPDIEYTVFDHIKYVNGFVEALDLKNVTFVLHAWGSVIGFEVARHHQDRLRAIACLESHLRVPDSRDMVSLPVQELTAILELPDGGYDIVMNSNYFVNRVLPRGVLRRLSEKELRHYQEPFNQPGSCKPLWQYLQDLPLGDENNEVTQLISKYSEWLKTCDVPKLMMYAIPGFITTVATVQWAKENISNIKSVDVGDGLHYAQESNPEKIASEIESWYTSL